MDKQQKKALRLQRRKWSVRNSVAGTPQRPRLSVFRSDKHIYAQVIDDVAGRTLAAASSTSAEVRSVRKPEPYKGEGIRYEGEVVKIKPGKAFAGAGAK